MEITLNILFSAVNIFFIIAGSYSVYGMYKQNKKMKDNLNCVSNELFCAYKNINDHVSTLIKETNIETAVLEFDEEKGVLSVDSSLKSPEMSEEITRLVSMLKPLYWKQITWKYRDLNIEDSRSFLKIGGKEI